MTAHLYSYLNGEFVESAKALVSVQDRGFRFGDGLFETISVSHARPYRLAQHLARLSDGLNALRITAETANLPGLCLELIRKNQMTEGILRITFTRGIGSRGYLPYDGGAPTILIETQDMPQLPQEAKDLWLSSYEKISARALPVSFKLSQGLNQTLARIEAEQEGCAEALMLNAEGEICEGSSSNIFWLTKGTLHTPALSCGILAGVTRGAILELSPYPVQEGVYSLEDLQKAEAVVITNSVWEALPVKGLQPKGYRWQSENLAQELREKLRADKQA